MKTDIFEDMKERVGCENISDLPYRKRAVWEIIKQPRHWIIQKNSYKSFLIMYLVQIMLL